MTQAYSAAEMLLVGFYLMIPTIAASVIALLWDKIFPKND